jgi:GT2 family glycosyltransferase
MDCLYNEPSRTPNRLTYQKNPEFAYIPEINLSTVPPIAIVIPCYNPKPDLLSETLFSLRQSTFQDYQVFLVNDSSTDLQSLTAMQQACENDSRISLVNLPTNRGLSAARNMGYKASQSAYLLFLDADDVIEPTFIEKCLWALESHPEWSFCNGWVMGFGARQYHFSQGFERRLEFLELNHTVAIAVIRREAHQAIGGYDETLKTGSEDWDYWLNMAAHGYWGWSIPEYLIGYRHHLQPTFWSTRDNLAQRQKFLQKMREKHPRLWQGKFPARLSVQHAPTHNRLPETNPFQNLLSKPVEKERVLFFQSWLDCSSINHLHYNETDVILCATAHGPHPEIEKTEQLGPDFFVLSNFLETWDYPRFLCYLIQSRQISRVVIQGSSFAKDLTPYLKYRFPDLKIEGDSEPEENSFAPPADRAIKAIQRAWIDRKSEQEQALSSQSKRGNAGGLSRLRQRLLHPMYYWLVSRGLWWLTGPRDFLLRVLK